LQLRTQLLKFYKDERRQLLQELAFAARTSTVDDISAVDDVVSLA